MIPFFSRRNQVYPVLRQDRPAVEKHFSHMEDWERETRLYQVLGGALPHPAVLHTEPGLLVTEYCPHPSLLDVLERQERGGFSPAPWAALADWLRRCFQICGQLPAEGNLRNFLWDAGGESILGLDFESFRPCPPEESAAELSAALLAYDPAGTPVKRQAAGLLVQAFRVPEETLADARLRLRLRREARPSPPPLSGIVLAGGGSRRMGTCKAALKLSGQTLLERQAEKLRALGIRDILLSGEDCPALPGTRVIPDALPRRGPLGGLHACLRAAEHPACLVLSVDTPLAPRAALAKLRDVHRGGVTVLRRSGMEEPLTGVYDSTLFQAIGSLIEPGGAPVRALERIAARSFFDYAGPPELLMNCNTPQEYAAAVALAERYGRWGLAL